MKAIGLDIGTTTICGVVLDGESGQVLFSRTLANDTAVKGEKEFERMQDPEKIWEKICQLLTEMEKEHPEADSIGVTGQMHGILYVDKNGEAVSPLYTWQDESGNQPAEAEEEEQYADSRTYAELLTEKTGCFAATGFGLTTHFYHLRNGMVPEGAEKLCTIGDYIVMKLTGGKEPLISPSNGASLGCFDLERRRFDAEALQRAGIDPAVLPEVRDGEEPAGYVQNSRLGDACEEADEGGMYAGVPVSMALGDNQASVIGTVKAPENSVLVNVGTGSQISVGTGKYIHGAAVELRPLVGGQYIFVGACLCGGRAYAALEGFFRQVAEMASGGSERLYGKMAELLQCTEKEADCRVTVNPQFCGTREQPSLRGSITGISLDNLTPQAFIRGFLYGIAGELHEMYQRILPHLEHRPEYLVGSGNGIRMNPALQEIFEELFGGKLQIPVHTEEAAYGTALFSLVAAGKYEKLEQAQEIIQYMSR